MNRLFKIISNSPLDDRDPMDLYVLGMFLIIPLTIKLSTI